jgi:lambda family phage portal protein
MSFMSRIGDFFKGATRSFEGAGGSGRWPISANMWAQNSQSLAARGVLNKRANYLNHNSPTTAAFVESWVTNLIGDGPTIKSSHPDPEIAKQLESNFNEWCMHCDIEGVDSLAGMLMTAVRSLVTSGEAIFHLPSDDGGNLFLRLLSSEQLDSTRTIPSLGLTGGMPRIIGGVETDEQGRRVAYWLLADPPDAVWASIFPSHRVDAVDVLHAFVRRFPGQVRGLSWLTPVATRLVELDQLEDSALMKARVSAVFAAFVSGDVADDAGIFKNMFGGNDASKPFDPNTLGLEPGTLQFLPPGAKVDFTPIADMSTVTDLMRHMMRSIAAGGGLSYEMLSGDLSQTNYSSARLGLSNFQRRIKALQTSLLGAQLLMPIWRRWVLLEILSGRISAPDFERAPLDYLNAKFLWPGWAPIDPLKQAKADSLDLSNKTRSRAEIVASNGRDISDVNTEIEADPLYVADPVAAAALLAQPEEQQNAS